jgi:hypothetical protein
MLRLLIPPPGVKEIVVGQSNSAKPVMRIDTIDNAHLRIVVRFEDMGKVLLRFPHTPRFKRAIPIVDLFPILCLKIV